MRKERERERERERGPVKEFDRQDMEEKDFETVISFIISMYKSTHRERER